MEKFNNLLKAAAILLKAEGFKKKGNTFSLFIAGNLAMLNFQKSNSSTKESVKFTINLGIQSAVLAKVLNEDPKRNSDITSCHWNIRIGSLLPQQQDLWWTLNNSNSPMPEIEKDVMAMLTGLILPVLKQRASDHHLIEAWLNAGMTGTTEYMRYVYLTILLREYKDERLPKLVNDFRSWSTGRSIEYAAKIHLQELGL